MMDNNQMNEAMKDLKEWDLIWQLLYMSQYYRNVQE